MNIIDINGKASFNASIPEGCSKLVYIGNISRIIQLYGVEEKYIRAYVKRGMYEIFCNKEITENIVNFVSEKYQETYMYEFISSHVGYSINLEPVIRPFMFNITYGLSTGLLGISKTGKKYLQACSKVGSLPCYKILLDIVNGKKNTGSKDFLNFDVSKLETDYRNRYAIKDMLESQMEIVPSFEDAIKHYNHCSTPLELMIWFDKYTVVYREYFGLEPSCANEMANMFFYSTRGNTIPNHGNIVDI